MKRVWFSIVLILVLASSVWGETLYVRGVQKITLRKEPGSDKKIVSMLASGQSLDVLGSGKGWTKVRSENGKEGWVLTRLVSGEKPRILLVESLEKKNEKLSERVSLLSDSESGLKSENRRLKRELSETSSKLARVTESLNSLKRRSENMLKLEKEHKEAVNKMQDAAVLTKNLQEELSRKNIKLFMYGAGVLLVGLIFGLSLRKNRSRSKYY